MEKQIEKLIAKAADAAAASEAMQYAQAASNAANALRALNEAGLYNLRPEAKPKVTTVGTPEALLEAARQSDTQSATLPATST